VPALAHWPRQASPLASCPRLPPAVGALRTLSMQASGAAASKKQVRKCGPGCTDAWRLCMSDVHAGGRRTGGEGGAEAGEGAAEGAGAAAPGGPQCYRTKRWRPCRRLRA
jgi:hypothetical protein